MVSRRAQTVVVFVVAVAGLQILFEDVVLFLGATGAGLPGVLNSPLVVVAVPLVLSLALFTVLVGGALLYSDSLR